MNAREQVAAATRLYTSTGKSIARAIAASIAIETKAMTILDLWGTGESARMFRSLIPDAVVVSVEMDPVLQPLLIQDAQTNGYAYHLGDVADVQGLYDFVWLDFCGQASKNMERTIKRISQKVLPSGTLAITMMPARETERLLAADNRLLHVPLWLERTTGRRVLMVLPYRRDNGQPMWFVVLRGDKGLSWFHDEHRFAMVEQDMLTDGWWAGPGSHEFLSSAAVTLLESCYDENVSNLEPDEALVRASQPKRVVKLKDLDAATRQLLLAMIDAGKASRKRRLQEWGQD